MNANQYMLFDQLIEGVQVIDRHFRYIYVNDATVRQSQSSREELLGHCMTEKFQGIEKTELYKHLKECLKHRKPHKMCNEFVFPNNSSGFFDLSIQPVSEGALILSIDVTEQKQTEIALKKNEEEYRSLSLKLEQRINERTEALNNSLRREKELNQVKSNFVSMASHEFRTPLTTILSSTSLLERYLVTGDIEKCTRHTTRVKNSVNTLIEILDDFLSLDKLEQGQVIVSKQTLNLKEMVTEIVSGLEGICKPNQYIKYTHLGIGTMTGDKSIFKHILLNLLSNAIKYSENTIELQTRADNYLLMIKVIDKGIGIPTEEYGNVFKQYFRSHNASGIQGTGLGLHIVKRYVELMKGIIGFKSTLNMGTTFTVYLPMEYQEEH